MQEVHQVTTYEKAIEAIEVGTCPPDPNVPSCFAYRLRPSEEAAILADRAANPPPPWGLKINLARTFIGPEKCVVIGRKLIVNKTVTFLDLSMCDMQEQAAEQFFKHLRQNKVLRHLSVNGNYIGDRGAIAAAPCLAKLEAFHCASNGITDIGADALADAVRTSPVLKTLSLRNNRITTRGIESLIGALLTPPPSPTSPSADGDTANDVSELKPPGADPLGLGTASSERGPDMSTTKPELLVEEGMESPPPEPECNKNLHTLWVDQNIDIPEELMERLALILAERFPKPPEVKKKKGKGAKKGA